MARITWDEDRIRYVCRRRIEGKYPHEIAEELETSESNVKRVLSHIKKRMGLQYPKLRHRLLKYDSARVNSWRSKVSAGSTYSEIAQEENVHRVMIGIKIRQQNMGELQF